MDIKLGKNDKRYVEGADDVYEIMQRILRRENKIDREKEHFWIIGMNVAGYILYIELVSLGSVREVTVEPMNIYRVAVMKNAARVIAVHNHPSGRLVPSKTDLDITDRLIQVGRILNIDLVDHLVISTETYESFRGMGLMDELERSLKYVPTYQVIEQIREEEKKIAKEAIKIAKGQTKTEREQRKKAEQEKERVLMSAANFLLEKNLDIVQIAKILEVTPKQIENVLKNIIKSDNQ